MPTSLFYSDLLLSVRRKTSNIEVKENFARASKMRSAMRGRCHAVGSMVAKHIAAEGKLAYRRCRKSMALLKQRELSKNPGDIRVVTQTVSI